MADANKLKNTGIKFRKDRPIAGDSPAFNELRYPLSLHESVLDELESRDNLKRRLIAVAARNTSKVMSCTGK